MSRARFGELPRGLPEVAQTLLPEPSFRLERDAEEPAVTKAQRRGAALLRREAEGNEEETELAGAS